MAFEELEGIPRGLETPNVYGPADAPLSVQESQLIGSVRKNDKAFVQDLVWTSQPQQAVGIDWSNPITRGLVAAYIGHTPNVNIATGNATVVTGGVVQALSSGRGWGLSASTDMIKDSVPISSGSDHTILLVGKIGGGGGAATNRILHHGDQLFGSGIFYSANTTNNQLEVAIGNLGVSNAPNTASFFDTSKSCVYGVTWKNSVGYDAYRDGSLIASQAYPISIGSTTTKELTLFNRSNGNRPAATDNRASLVLVFSRGLSSNDHRSLSQNPWQIFKPIPAKLKHYIPQQPLLPSKVGVPGLIEQSKRPWSSQPQQVTGVNRDAFPGRPLVYASRVSDGCFDLVGNRPPVAVSASSPTTSVSSAGVAGEFVPANSQYYSITTATNLVSGYPLTVACWARIDSITAGGVMYSLNGTGYSAILGLLSTGFLINQASSNGLNTSSASSYDLGWHHIVCVHRSNTYSLYVDGILRSQTSTGNFWTQPVAGNHSIGNRLNGPSPQFFDGAIQDLYVFQGELTYSEAKSLYRNHWQVFQPLSYKQFVGKNTLPPIKVYRQKLQNKTLTALPYILNPRVSTKVVDGFMFINNQLISIKNKALINKASQYAGDLFPVSTPYGPVITENANAAGNTVITLPGNNYSDFSVICAFYIRDKLTSGSCGLGHTESNDPALAANANVGMLLECTSTGMLVKAHHNFNSTVVSAPISPGFHIAVANFAYSKGYISITIDGGSVYKRAPFSGDAYHGLDIKNINSYSATPWGTVNRGSGAIFVGASSLLTEDEARSISKNAQSLFGYSQVDSPRVVNTSLPVKPQPLLPKYNPWTSQPQQAVGIDWDNPITRGLVLASNPTSLSVIGIDGKEIGRWITSATEPGSPPYMTQIPGYGNAIMSTHDYADLTGTSASISNDSDISFLCVFVPIEGTYARTYMARGCDTAGAGWSFNISRNINGTILAGIVLTSGGTVGYTATSSAVIPVNTPVLAVATWSKASGKIELFVNGKKEAETSTGGKTVMRSSTLGIRLGGAVNVPASYSGGSYGKVGLSCVWSRGLTEKEALSLSANPWQSFKPIKYPARLK